MVYVLHKFRHYLLSNKFFFYVDHMALLYLVWKLQISRKTTKWLFFFLKYILLVIYKPRRFHFVADALSHMLDFIKENGILDQTIDATLFLLESTWLHEIFKYLIIGKKYIYYTQEQKK